jgi:uncharacterized protein YpmS
MMRSIWKKRFLLLTGLAFLWIVAVSEVFFSPADVLAEANRGDEPQCQEGCLTHHSERMGILAQEYMKTRDKSKYQDQVEKELQTYSRCLTNCREVLPVK